MLLGDLNKIWREREIKQVQRIKKQTREEVNDMKRKLSHRAPYDVIYEKKCVGHLKSKLQQLAQEVQLLTGEKSKKKYADLPAGLELIEHTLTLLAKMQQEKRGTERVNEEMVDRMKVLEAFQRDEVHDKNKFMEGAIWMGKRLSSEVERTCQSFESMA